MILNISGRTDIVAFYSNWLINRLEVGFTDVINPFNPKMISRIMMEDVDLLFFCTKNPMPILDKLKDIKKKVYFHVTLTPYKKDIEPNIPPKKDIIEAIKKLSIIIGKENLVIRYDPIFISEEYNLDYHLKAFDKICECVEMIDIGVYNSCKHFCKYCYANFDERQVSDNYNKHNPKSSLLIGEIHSDDIIKVRKN